MSKTGRYGVLDLASDFKMLRAARRAAREAVTRSKSQPLVTQHEQPISESLLFSGYAVQQPCPVCLMVSTPGGRVCQFCRRTERLRRKDESL